MIEPTRDVLEYWGVPDVDAPLPLVPCTECGGIVCHCEPLEQGRDTDPDAA